MQNYSKFRTVFVTFLSMSLLVLASVVIAEDDKSVTIRGDKESPTVLYLVPWKQTPQTQGNTDFEMELDYENKPLSRSEVVREIRYYKDTGYDKTSDSANKAQPKVFRR